MAVNADPACGTVVADDGVRLRSASRPSDYNPRTDTTTPHPGIRSDARLRADLADTRARHCRRRLAVLPTDPSPVRAPAVPAPAGDAARRAAGAGVVRTAGDGDCAAEGRRGDRAR